MPDHPGTTPPTAGARLDQDRPDTGRPSVAAATPRQPGVKEIRIPSERAFRERERRRFEGIVVERKVVEALHGLAVS